MPVPEELIYEGNFTVRTSEIDRSKNVTVSALVNLMQEAAMQNVIELKVSVWDMESEQISWVLMRKQLHIHRLPVLGESIKIKTYPAGFDRLFTYRDYKVFDQKGELIADSGSTWVLMNTKKRRIARIPEAIRVRGQFDNSDCLPHAKAKLPLIDQVDVQQDFLVCWHDLDFNEHLNNVRYLQWILETIEEYLSGKWQLKTMNVIYKAECYLRDTVRVTTEYKEDLTCLHELKRLSDGELIAQVETIWEAL